MKNKPLHGQPVPPKMEDVAQAILNNK